MAFDFPSSVPEKSGMNYHKLPAVDPRVIRRAPIWVADPVIFSREACNFFLHWYQERFVRDNGYFIAASWSRQIGKTTSVAIKAIWHAFTKPNACVVIIAPGKRQAQIMYRKIAQIIRSSPLIYNSVAGKIKVEETAFKNGSLIVNLPSGDEGETLRGYTITLLIVDEGAYVSDAVYVAVEQGLSSSGGQEIVISTPRGRHNEFYRMFFPNVENHFPVKENGLMENGHFQVGDWSCHHYDYTVGLGVLRPDGTPQLSKFHLEKQRRKLPSWQFRSEYLAEFVENVDSYFPAHLVDRMFNPNFNKVPGPIAGGEYFAGIDIAKGFDFTAIAVAQRLNINPITGQRLLNPHVRIVDLFYGKYGTIEEQYPHFISMSNKWKPAMIYFDKKAIGERPFEELRNNYSLAIEGVSFTAELKVKLFGTLNTLMSTQAEIQGWESRIQCYQDGEAITEFKNVVYDLTQTKTSTGRMRPGEHVRIYAAKGHDDIPISFALACMCVSGIDVNAPLAIMVKPGMEERNAYVHSLASGIPCEVQGFGTKLGSRSNRRRHRKVFWAKDY